MPNNTNHKEKHDEPLRHMIEDLIDEQYMKTTGDTTAITVGEAGTFQVGLRPQALSRSSFWTMTARRSPTVEAMTLLDEDSHSGTIEEPGPAIAWDEVLEAQPTNPLSDCHAPRTHHADDLSAPRMAAARR